MRIDKDVERILDAALREDSARKDITSRLMFDSNHRLVAEIVAGNSGILCGEEIARRLFKKMDPGCKITRQVKDGDKVSSGDVIMDIRGSAFGVLSAERTALNFLQHLSGVATLTRKFVDAVKGTKAKIYDTRKTIPGIRALQKYAVRCGGGCNHRMDLSEMAMVKDNHLKAVTRYKVQVTSLKAKLPKGMKLEIEAKNMKEVELALKSEADIILLDNMTIPQLKKAIRFIHHSSFIIHRSPLVEVSGGVTLQNVGKIAKLGVDRISVGALTHSAPTLDISLDVILKKSK